LQDDSFGTNYIIFRNAEIFTKNLGAKKKIFVKENEEYFEIS
jgi:hypothetical protein